MILLISTNETLVETLTAVLPASAPLLHLATPTEIQPYLKSVASDKLEPFLILIEVAGDLTIVIDCRQLCQENTGESVPIIAIIAQPADRQAVLEAGADDYLLLPLLPAEIQVRLANYLRSASRGLNIWVEAFHYLNKGAAPTQVLNRSLKRLAQTFNAPSTWLFLLDEQEQINLVSSYNLPPAWQQESMILNNAAIACLKVHQQEQSKMPQVIASSDLIQANQPEPNELTHYLSIPLHNHQRLIGVLNLAYTAPPAISRIEQQALARLGQDIGILLEMFQVQEETQVYATQNAFMILIARTISERLDLNTILTLTLEQTAPLLNASGGDIWLLSADGQWLELASSLSLPFAKRSVTRRAKGQGVIGWVMQQDRSLLINQALIDDPRFDPQVDLIEGQAIYSLLATPLRHRQTTIGVLMIYSERGLPFSKADTILVEGIASLTASAIANARLMQELRDYADQQRVLYEMSQQIAGGLDLQTTLKRALQWVNRLFEAEVGLLWLVEQPLDQDNDQADKLRLVAALGIELPQEPPAMISLEQDLMGWVARTGQAVMVNDPASDPRVTPLIGTLLNMTMPRNIICAPMIYHEQTIGVTSMFNKVSGHFDEVDLTLLLTAIEMIAVAVGNARLHTQTVALMTEREHLHKQILQAERLATVGRLTANLSHEINNPMQTIRGALTLALEELDNPAELATYLQMSLQETERVVQLLSRMRQIYRPQSGIPETVDVNRLLQEAITIAQKELRQQQVILQIDFAPELPPLVAIAGQLHLVFLILILNLSDNIGAAGGGELGLRTCALTQGVLVEFATDTPITAYSNWVHLFEPDTAQTTHGPARPEEGDASFGLSLSCDIILAHGGLINFDQQAGQTLCRIKLPLSPPDLPTRP